MLESSLHECVNALSDLEKPARNFYAEELNLRSNQFIEMMLVDGCFIIELLLKYALKGIRRSGDPIFVTPGLLNKNDSQPFTSYALLMQAMVCTENDAKLFHKLRILIMNSYPEKEACDLFKRLCRKVDYEEDKFYFAGLIEQILEYKRVPKSWRKILKCSWLKTRTT
ncbi:uncharacterized protein HKW66_Vig0021210 [Vigna angularis]|uniref:Uncharacterized protein n=1 Tax=Phaseolus angularis TaxID=3914 RepID=A0A8T0L5Y6_PHAAN|nr:uncharacterized protein HKW66_Vig0021210 [Vigna angularis]